jgi:hypothetical protein
MHYGNFFECMPSLICLPVEKLKAGDQCKRRHKTTLEEVVEGGGVVFNETRG